MNLNRISIVILGSVILNGQPVWAEETISDASGSAQAMKISGSVRGSAWSSSMSLDGRKDISSGALWLKSEPMLGENAGLVLDGWIMGDHDSLDTKKQNRLREGYFNLSVGNADFRIGKQIIVWGRADKFNPTDNLSPRDYTLLVVEDEDQRFGTYAAKASYSFNDWSLTGYWLPEFKPNILPIPHQPGVNFSENISKGQGGGIKIDQTGKEIDWSVSYFDGFDLNPDISIGSATASGVNLLLNHHRIQTIGTDATTVVGRYALRAEAAYTRTEDRDGLDPFIKNPFFYMVAGGDRTFFEYLNVNIQFLVRYVSQYQDPLVINNPALRAVAIQEAVVNNQFDRVQHGMTFRISDKWLHETLEAEFSGITSLNRRDFVLKPKLIYSFSDQWKGSFGANLFRGDDNSYYGRLKDNSTVYVEIKDSF